MQLELIPIHENIGDNKEFESDPLCNETLQMTIDFFNKVGYKIPWIGYYAKLNETFVGSCAFKGSPQNGIVEIAYGTFEPYRQKGIGTAICKQLIELALKTDPFVKVTARTLAEENFSTKILKKNGFKFSGVVNDAEDGDVWEWILKDE